MFCGLRITFFLALKSRNCFLTNEARIILIHLNGLEDRSLFQKLVGVLENFFLLVCRMNGTVRVPHFGIVVLSTQYKVFLPLQHVRGNHMKISMALSKLKWYLEDMSDVCRDGVGDLDLIAIGIQEAVCLYYKQAQYLASGCSSQLELTIFSTQSQKSVVSSVKNAARQLDFQHIRKIQTVFLRSMQDAARPSLSSACVDKNNDSTFWQDDLEPSGFMETSVLDPTVPSIHSFFMSWLHTFDTDAEFLRIKFGSGFVVRCDAHERIVNPLCLDFHKALDLSTSLLETRPISGTFPRDARRIPYADKDDVSDEEGVHELEVVALVDLDAICDSLLFGNPLILKATSCWKLDWDELESNQQHFHSLCHHLNAKHRAMLVKLNHNSLTSNKRRRKEDFANIEKIPKPRQVSSSSSSSFRPHYVVLPSPTCSLLLKSIVSGELLIPLDVPPLGNCQENSQQTLESELAAVEILPTYDPFSMTSNLFASLRSSACRSPDDSSDDDIDVGSLPPAPKMLSGSDAAKSKNIRGFGTHGNGRNNCQLDCNSSTKKKSFAPTVPRTNRVPTKRKLYDPATLDVCFPSEL